MKSSIALVTGGNRGLGKAAVLSLARQGVDTVLTYRSHQEEADAVVNEVRALGRKAVALQLDVGKVAEFARFAETLKGALEREWSVSQFDFLVNNAGVGVYVPFAETTEAQFDEVMNVHFKGVFFLTQKLLPLISDGGRIINLSSGLARYSYPGSSAYGSMKGAIEVWTRYLATELGSRRIAVNVVAPGAIATDFGGGRVRNNKELSATIASRTALGRVGEADDIGGVIAFLCSPAAKWINGQRLEASGGIHL